MVKKLKVYLDTSIVNFLYTDDSPHYRKATEVFFENIILTNKIDAYISNVVIDEINKTVNMDHRNILLGTFEKYSNIKTLFTENEITEEIAFLAEAYVNNKIIPKDKTADAFHIAYSTVFQMDILLSWNFKHLANINKEHMVMILNKKLGYNYPFRMANPLEVYYEE
jgi:predicted nucleic acid-binding protein